MAETDIGIDHYKADTDIGNSHILAETDIGIDHFVAETELFAKGAHTRRDPHLFR